MLDKLSFSKLLAALLVVAVIVGIAVDYAASDTTTNKGTPGAISAENAQVMAAEKASCNKHGKYASLSTLESDGLLSFKPTYNAVVYVPGKGCGTLVVGSAAYQPVAG